MEDFIGAFQLSFQTLFFREPVPVGARADLIHWQVPSAVDPPSSNRTYFLNGPYSGARGGALVLENF